MPPKKPEPVVAAPVEEVKVDPTASDEQPKEGRLAWTHLRNTAIKAFLALEQPSDMIQWVALTLELGDPLTDARAAVLTDLYLSLLLLAKSSGFSEEKLSTFFSIVRLLHDNTLQHDWDAAAAYAWLKTTVMQHSVKTEQAPPVFAAADVRVVTDFAIKGYIQHLLLYKFCFKQPQPEDTCTVSLYVNEALPFQPLHSSKSAKQVADSAAAAAADSHSAATAQGAADEAAAADSSSDSAAASDPMQDIIKKAVQSQVAALSEELSGRWDAKMQHLQQRLQSLEAK